MPESPSAVTSSTPPSTDGVPLSRRAAREAAAQQTAPTPAPAEVGTAPVRAARATDAAGPATQPLTVGGEEEPWIFTAAAAAPTVPYTRGGAQRSRDAAPPSTEHPASTTTLDSLFAGTAADGGVMPPPKKRRRRRIGGWIALGVVLLLVGGAVTGGLWVWNTYESQIRELMGWEDPKDYADGLAHGEAFVTVLSGDTGASISRTLYESGVTMTPDAFYEYLIDTGQNPPFEPGVFKLQEQMTSAAALEAMFDPANRMENTARLREGLTVTQSVEELAVGTGIPLEEFQAAVANPADYGVTADSLEGWLFPATYTFNPGVTAPQVIQTLVNRTIQSLDSAGVPVEDRHRVLTIASIIQREAGFEQDFYNVSRVIVNRLDPSNNETFGLLQMDSTAKYGVGEDASGSLDVSTHAQTDDNPWNTYLHPGLPIGPISNPGDLAIDAAMHPADGPWLYFVTVDPSTGETEFTSTYGEHLRYVEQWQAWCAAHPDYPC